MFTLQAGDGARGMMARSWLVSSWPGGSRQLMLQCEGGERADDSGSLHLQVGQPAQWYGWMFDSGSLQLQVGQPAQWHGWMLPSCPRDIAGVFFASAICKEEEVVVVVEEAEKDEKKMMIKKKNPFQK